MTTNKNGGPAHQDEAAADEVATAVISTLAHLAYVPVTGADPGATHPPRDVGFVALVRRRGRLVRSISLGEDAARRTVRAAHADGFPAVVVPVRLAPLDGLPLDDRLPVDVKDEVRPRQEVTKRTRRRRDRRLDRLVPVEDAVDLGAYNGGVLHEVDDDKDLDLAAHADHDGRRSPWCG